MVLHLDLYTLHAGISIPIYAICNGRYPIANKAAFSVCKELDIYGTIWGEAVAASSFYKCRREWKNFTAFREDVHNTIKAGLKDMHARMQAAVAPAGPST